MVRGRREPSQSYLGLRPLEQELGGRIRDKIAASKKKGIWMGGVVPLGYRVESRALHVVEEHAAFVRDLFRRYLEIGSVVRLDAVLNQGNIRLPIRTDALFSAFRPSIHGQNRRCRPAVGRFKP